MTIQYLPFNATPDRLITVSLDGVSYKFRTQWNDRAEAWFCEVYSASGELLVPSRALRTLTPWPDVASDAWPYRLILNRPLGGSDDPGVDELGGAVRVLCGSVEEWAEAGGG